MRFLRAYFFFYFSLHAKMPRTTSPVHSFPWLSCTSCVRVMYSACPFFCQWTRLSYDTVMFYYVTFDSCLFFFCCSTSSVQKHFLYFIYLFLHPPPLPPFLMLMMIADTSNRDKYYIYYIKFGILEIMDWLDFIWL